jgi:hypothetical protein
VVADRVGGGPAKGPVSAVVEFDGDRVFGDVVALLNNRQPDQSQSRPPSPSTQDGDRKVSVVLPNNLYDDQERDVTGLVVLLTCPLGRSARCARPGGRARTGRPGGRSVIGRRAGRRPRGSRRWRCTRERGRSYASSSHGHGTSTPRRHCQSRWATRGLRLASTVRRDELSGQCKVPGAVSGGYALPISPGSLPRFGGTRGWCCRPAGQCRRRVSVRRLRQ